LRNVSGDRRNAMKSRLGLSSALVLLVIAAPAAAQKRPEAKDMTLLGYDDLQGRSAYQPTIHAQNGRWIAYIGRVVWIIRRRDEGINGHK